MKLVEKEIAILNALEASDFKLFDGDKEDALKNVERALRSMVDYVNIVVNQQIMLPMYAALYEGEELRDKTMDLDSKRRFTHDNCIAQLNMLNVICKKHGLEPFADIDTTDRYVVADFAGRFVSELYLDGTGRTMDDVSLNREEPFDTVVVKEHVLELDAEIERVDREEAYDEI